MRPIALAILLLTPGFSHAAETTGARILFSCVSEDKEFNLVAISEITRTVAAGDSDLQHGTDGGASPAIETVADVISEEGEAQRFAIEGDAVRATVDPVYSAKFKIGPRSFSVKISERPQLGAVFQSGGRSIEAYCRQ